MVLIKSYDQLHHLLHVAMMSNRCDNIKSRSNEEEHIIDPHTVARDHDRGSMGTLSAHGQVKSQTIDKIIAHLDPRDGLRITADLMMDKTPIRGEYYALGENFHYDTPQMKAWYNAKDLWVYLDRNDEVNLSTPMKEEDLTEINPLLNLNVIKEQRFRIVENYKNGTYTLTATPEELQRCNRACKW